VDTWHHIPERVAYANSLRRALAPGGALIVVEFTPDSPRGPPEPFRIAPSTLMGELRAAGFHWVEADAGLPYQYVVIAI
jgi:hypothetical protein